MFRLLHERRPSEELLRLAGLDIQRACSGMRFNEPEVRCLAMLMLLASSIDESRLGENFAERVTIPKRKMPGALAVIHPRGS